MHAWVMVVCELVFLPCAPILCREMKKQNMRILQDRLKMREKYKR